MKKQICIAALTLMIAIPVTAQDDEGSSMMERGAQEFLEGLLKEMEPAWNEMQSFMDEMGPSMIELMDQVKDWSAYDAPEVLENGDIIIRRKPDAEKAPQAAPEPLPQIEL